MCTSSFRVQPGCYRDDGVATRPSWLYWPDYSPVTVTHESILVASSISWYLSSARASRAGLTSASIELATADAQRSRLRHEAGRVSSGKSVR